MPLDNYGRIMQDSAEFAMMPYNAMMNRREFDSVQARRNQLVANETREMEEDARFEAALANRDFDTAARIDPHTTALYQQHLQQQAMSGLGEIPITAKPIDQNALYERGMDERKFALDAAQERRLSQPQQSSAPTAEERDFSRYESMTPEQRSLYERMKGRAVNDGDSKPMSAKDANTARVKLTQVAVARRQLQDAQAKYSALKDTLSAGPGGNLIPSPKGKAYDAAIDTMRSSISALTRVPGVGAMSDFETRLDQAKFPSRGNYEQVGEQQLQALGDQLDTIESSYREMLGGKSPPPAPAADQGKKAAPNPGDNVKGYIFIGGDPKVRKNWVKSQ